MAGGNDKPPEQAERIAATGNGYAAIWDLTPAEALLAHALAEGLSLAEFGDRRGISLNTVKSQLKAVFRKTGTHRQGELIRLLLTTAPAPRAPHPKRSRDPAPSRSPS